MLRQRTTRLVGGSWQPAFRQLFGDESGPSRTHQIVLNKLVVARWRPNQDVLRISWRTGLGGRRVISHQMLKIPLEPVATTFQICSVGVLHDCGANYSMLQNLPCPANETRRVQKGVALRIMISIHFSVLVDPGNPRDNRHGNTRDVCHRSG